MKYRLKVVPVSDPNDDGTWVEIETDIEIVNFEHATQFAPSKSVFVVKYERVM